jgi:hypothetical protein
MCLSRSVPKAFSEGEFKSGRGPTGMHRNMTILSHHVRSLSCRHVRFSVHQPPGIAILRRRSVAPRPKTASVRKVTIRYDGSSPASCPLRDRLFLFGRHERLRARCSRRPACHRSLKIRNTGSPPVVRWWGRILPLRARCKRKRANFGTRRESANSRYFVTPGRRKSLVSQRRDRTSATK